VRFLAKVTIPRAVGDEAAKSGALQRTVQSALAELKPEAAYFFEQDGNRECVFVVNLDVAAMLRPLFPNLQPSIFVTPVVNAAEFQQGLGEEGKQAFAQRSDFLADLDPATTRPPGSQPAAEDPEGPVPLRSRTDELASKRGPPG
jgi:hypothetical protein